MAVLDARNCDEIFRMAINPTVEFAARLKNDATHYDWRTTGADYIYATGTGIAVNAAGKPVRGLATKLQIDLSHDDTVRNNDIDITIRGIRAPLVDLTRADTGEVSISPDADLFWRTVLKGNDVIYAPLTKGATIFGDFVHVSDDATGGNDRINSGLLGGQTLIGDALSVGDDTLGLGSLKGGNDTIVANNSRGLVTLIGDVSMVLLASLKGGRDTLTGSNVRPDIIIGDAETVVGEDGSGSAVGGNDSISGRGGADRLIGDFVASGPEAYVVCGSDLIRGGTGNDVIIGDIDSYYNQLDLGPSYGGNDRVFGDDGNDTIYGDARVVELGEFLDGNDRVYGGAGNDVLYGDSAETPQTSYLIDSVIGTDLLDGGTGNDRLFGYHGNDRLFGGAGLDQLNGGLGSDALAGGADGDRFIFRESGPLPENVNGSPGVSADRILDFQDDVDQIELESGYGFADAAGVLTAATADGNDVVIDLSNDSSIRLVGYLVSNTIASLENDIVIV